MNKRLSAGNWRPLIVKLTDWYTNCTGWTKWQLEQ